MDATGHDRRTPGDSPDDISNRRGEDTIRPACNDRGTRLSNIGGGTTPSAKAPISSGKLEDDGGGSFIPSLGSHSHSAGSVQDIEALSIGNAGRLCTRDAASGQIFKSSDTLGRPKVMTPQPQALPVKPCAPGPVHQLAPASAGSVRPSFTADECLVKVSEYVRLHAEAVTRDNQVQIKRLEETVRNFQAALGEVAAQRDHFKQRVGSLEAMGNQGRRIDL
ncbi:hypothetical protein BJX66DRAFT_345945 [Aspergillus keveii]|uniref:Uncharacterized protein n=1 Tax=Aspergillus keveii TaxID=714993 RepID=A0ABR4FGY1_9EURO